MKRKACYLGLLKKKGRRLEEMKRAVRKNQFLFPCPMF